MAGEDVRGLYYGMRGLELGHVGVWLKRNELGMKEPRRGRGA